MKTKNDIDGTAGYNMRLGIDLHNSIAIECNFNV